MLIDWFTTLAQLINFAVLLWLLKRFLYKPVLNAIDARERAINDRLDQAKLVQGEAQQQLKQYQQQQAELQQQREGLLHEASAAAATERQRLLAKARDEAKQLRAQQDASLRYDIQRLHTDIVQRTQQQVLAMTRTALSNLAGEDLETRMVERFIARLQNLSTAESAQLQQDLRSRQYPAQVRSAFEVSTELQARVRSVLRQVLSIDEVQFKVTPELIGGVELTTDGHRLSWNLASFVGDIEERLLRTADTTDLGAQPAVTATA